MMIRVKYTITSGPLKGAKLTGDAEYEVDKHMTLEKCLAHARSYPIGKPWAKGEEYSVTYEVIKK